MAESVEHFKEITRDLLEKLHKEINETAVIVAHVDQVGRSDHEIRVRYSQLRIDLLTAVFAALMAERNSVPTLELRHVPKWARGSSLDEETVEADPASYGPK